MSVMPELAYLVCATQRSGSTVLCETLRATGIAGRPFEHFELLRHSGRPRQAQEHFAGVSDPAIEALLPPPAPVDPARTLGAEPAAAWWARIVRDGTTPNGIWGGKLMWDHTEDFVARASLLPGLADADLSTVLDRLLGEVRLVHVRREDKVAQAVSFWRAMQTQSWRHDRGVPDAPAEYHFGAIDQLVALLERDDAAWLRWFEATGRTPLTLVYEQLRSAPQEGVAQVLRLLDLPVAEQLPEPALARQRDATSREWAQRYREARSRVAV
ncbi:Stf0 family sulfotransferase [Conexibacter sp. CPCC 206217]|uniref:Stf0 family sulfotransferase n=1 Tax=Conexibacter sp. CPCC 206217 TaxID=3064574 RepID=UPI002728AB85|nr:Stf0 family sulfotransferase [Conexibacter sp. CPCC 206217]MDO8212325.1 Stf0 family sulfotransferase [Conexibacter sp. CPCC 206217]